VKFSFERYQGTGVKEFRSRVQRVDVVDPLTVRFQLKEPWPDFMTFYGTTATAAGIVVPKKYLTQVGDDGFRKHPIGAGPYKFVSPMVAIPTWTISSSSRRGSGILGSGRHCSIASSNSESSGRCSRRSTTSAR
jgi:ABC-type transport system substrate-binding protein